MGAKSDAPCAIGTPCRVPVAPFGEGSWAEREFAVHELCNGKEQRRLFPKAFNP